MIEKTGNFRKWDLSFQTDDELQRMEIRGTSHRNVWNSEMSLKHTKTSQESKLQYRKTVKYLNAIL